MLTAITTGVIVAVDWRLAGIIEFIYTDNLIESVSSVYKIDRLLSFWFAEGQGKEKNQIVITLRASKSKRNIDTCTVNEGQQD